MTGSTTKARRRNIITKRKLLGCVENPVGQLPRKLDNGMIKVKKEKLTPSGRPVKRAKKREKLLHTVRRSDQLRKDKQIS